MMNRGQAKMMYGNNGIADSNMSRYNNMNSNFSTMTNKMINRPNNKMN
jgi:hypothetical protein